MYKRRRTRKLAVEKLGRRDLLAGDCVAALDDGELSIECDNQDNELFVQQLFGELNVVGTSGTTINGQSSVSFGQVELEEIEIELGKGNDNLGVTFVTAEEIEIEAGKGNDQVVLLGVTAEEAEVEMGPGDDLLLVNASTFGEIEMEGGPGFDVLSYLINTADEVEEEGFEVGGL